MRGGKVNLKSQAYDSFTGRLSEIIQRKHNTIDSTVTSSFKFSQNEINILD